MCFWFYSLNIFLWRLNIVIILLCYHYYTIITGEKFHSGSILLKKGGKDLKKTPKISLLRLLFQLWFLRLLLRAYRVENSRDTLKLFGGVFSSPFLPSPLFDIDPACVFPTQCEGSMAAPLCCSRKSWLVSLRSGHSNNGFYFLKSLCVSLFLLPFEEC